MSKETHVVSMCALSWAAACGTYYNAQFAIIIILRRRTSSSDLAGCIDTRANTAPHRHVNLLPAYCARGIATALYVYISAINATV